MPLRRLTCAAATLVAVVCLAAGCTRETPADVQDVQLETVAPQDLPRVPTLDVVPLGPQLVYTEPLPLPAAHRVSVQLLPSGATTLRQVERVEVTVEVDDGAPGNRDLGVVFASPAGPVWERQVRRADKLKDQTLTVTFVLPVAATLIEDQGLSGAWTLTTLDDGVALATAGFTLAD